ncbi:MAG: 4a-hydroxytetrahydrobiopterin dehydratase [Bryobacteraceae bacterium]|jgi:4a-hydroxytetrahydrobiopterin dehydratase
MAASRAVLSADALRRHAAHAPDWKVVDQHHIARTFQFPDFVQALDFVNRVGAVAERQGHHPDIHLTWGRVDVESWTHDAGGITEKDFQLAAGIDSLKT